MTCAHVFAANLSCFADLAAVGTGHPQRGLDVVIRRLAARDARTDARQRGAAPVSRQERS